MYKIIYLLLFLFANFANAQKVYSVIWKVTSVDVDTTGISPKFETFLHGTSMPYYQGDVLKFYKDGLPLVDSFVMKLKNRTAVLDRSDFVLFYKNCGPEGVPEVLELEVMFYLIADPFGKPENKEFLRRNIPGVVIVRPICGEIGLDYIRNFKND